MNIAIIDDRNAELFPYYFSHSHHRATAYTTGEAFLQDCCNPDFIVPDILIIDHNLGRGLNGTQVLVRSLQLDILKNTIFVSSTAWLNEDDRLWLNYIGFDDFLDQPYTLSELREFIEKLFKKRDLIIEKRDPLGKMRLAIEELSKLRLLTKKLEEEYIKRLISPEIFRALENNPQSLRPQYSKVAVGFIDIRGFTRLSNQYPGNQINSILELFFEYMADIVIRHGGFIDKFIGDEVLWFNRSESLDFCSKECINTATAMLQGIEDLNKKIREKLCINIKIRCGIGTACGDALVGIFGSPTHRIQYSILGPVVNLASRLCGEARNNELLVGGEMIKFLSHPSIKVGFRSVKGFDHEVLVHKVRIKKQKKLTSETSDPTEPSTSDPESSKMNN